MTKKYKKKTINSVRYECRQKVAQKRLRVKGRFMTKAQALEALGMTQDQLMQHEEIQQLLNDHCNAEVNFSSFLTSTKDGKSSSRQTIHKVCNMQVLLEGSHFSGGAHHSTAEEKRATGSRRMSDSSKHSDGTHEN